MDEDTKDAMRVVFRDTLRREMQALQMRVIFVAVNEQNYRSPAAHAAAIVKKATELLDVSARFEGTMS